MDDLLLYRTDLLYSLFILRTRIAAPRSESRNSTTGTAVRPVASARAKVKKNSSRLRMTKNSFLSVVETGQRAGCGSAGPAW